MEEKEEMIEINYETIGIMEQRHLIDMSKLNRCLTKEEFLEIVGVYNDVIDRLLKLEKVGKENE